jgi:hypothetical protein
MIKKHAISIGNNNSRITGRKFDNRLDNLEGMKNIKNGLNDEISKPWKEIHAKFENLMKRAEKEPILYCGRVVNSIHVKHGSHHDCEFLCERVANFSGPFPLIQIKICSKGNKVKIDPADILVMEGYLKRNALFKPMKVHNITKDLGIRI